MWKIIGESNANAFEGELSWGHQNETRRKKGGLVPMRLSQIWS